MSLRIVLLGTGEFAIPPFRALLECEDYHVVGVYTQPDRTGRGHHRHLNPVKVLAEEHGVRVFQPEKVNSPDALEELSALQADLFVVAAYGQIMKPEFLAIPRLGAFNLHGSLLPRHRGAAPVQYSIWKGDREAGVTIFQIEPALDSGPMIGKVSTPIGVRETSGELMIRLAELSVDLTLHCVRQLADGSAVFESQDASLVTLAPKIPKEAGVIDWSQSATEIDCHIRAMTPWPRASAWLHVKGRKPLRCLFVEAQPAAADVDLPLADPGTIDATQKGLWVHTGGGILDVLSIQPAGKKATDAAAFINGYGLASAAARFRPDESLTE